MKTKLFLLVTAGVLVFGLTVHAHHSITSTYDAKTEVKLEGKLIAVLFRNPHVFVSVDVPDEEGNVQRWSLEWGSATNLASKGQIITRDTFKAGDRIIVTGNPSRTIGERRVKLNTLTRPSDGLTWGTRPGEVVD